MVFFPRLTGLFRNESRGLSTLVVPAAGIAVLFGVNAALPNKHFVPAMLLVAVLSVFIAFSIAVSLPLPAVVTGFYLCGIHFINLGIYNETLMVTSSGMMSALFFSFIIIEKTGSGRIRAANMPYWQLFLAFIAVTGISVFIAVMHGNYWVNSVREFISYPSIFITAVMLAVFLDERMLIRLAVMLIGIGSLIGGFGFLEYVTSSKVEHYYEYKTRVGSVFGSPNALAAYLELLFPLTFAYVLMPGQTLKRRMLLTAALLMQLAGALLTFSRGAFAGILLASGIVIFTGIHSTFKKTLVIVIAVSVLAAASTTALLQRQFNIFDVETMVSNDMSTLGRVGQLLTSAQAVAENPWWGVGPGCRSTTGFFPRFYPSSQVIYYFGHLNNMYLDVATKFGLPAALMYFIFVWGGLIRGYRSIRSAVHDRDMFMRYTVIGLFAGLATVSLHLFFDAMVKWPPMNYIFGIFWGMFYYGLGRIRESGNQPVPVAAGGGT